MLQDGLSVWRIDEFEEAVEVVLSEAPKGSGHFYYVNELIDDYDRITDVFFTKEEAENACIK